jgi:8-oxo-dGTP pyrophosphatase MutT (NUDIX family)
MYKVFFNDCYLALSFTENDGKNLNAAISQYSDFNQVENWFTKAANCQSDGSLLLIHKNPEEIWGKIRQLFVYIEAAGGLVKNKKNEYLFIYKKGRWDLPKGKIDKDETPPKAAIREICEETGLKKVKITTSITSTYHIFRMRDNKLALKKTYWFLCSNEGSENLVCEKEENIEKAEWISNPNLEVILNQSYGSIVDVFSEYENIKNL